MQQKAHLEANTALEKAKLESEETELASRKTRFCRGRSRVPSNGGGNEGNRREK